MKLTRKRALSTHRRRGRAARRSRRIARAATQSLSVGQIGNSVAFFPIFVAPDSSATSKTPAST